jgi:putative transposase
MKYNPDIYHRRSLRLPDYDYSAAGYYYVTICTFKREVIIDRVELVQLVTDAWEDLPQRFKGVGLDEFVVMPNHLHGIVVFCRQDNFTLGDVMRAFKSISAIAANRHLGRSGRPFWQRNYYERIIRGERELDAIREYIHDNPLKWGLDPDNPQRIRTA